jgi:hypothetical protein
MCSAEEDAKGESGETVCGLRMAAIEPSIMEKLTARLKSTDELPRISLPIASIMIQKRSLNSYASSENGSCL